MDGFKNFCEGEYQKYFEKKRRDVRSIMSKKYLFLDLLRSWCLFELKYFLIDLFGSQYLFKIYHTHLLLIIVKIW